MRCIIPLFRCSKITPKYSSQSCNTLARRLSLAYTDAKTGSLNARFSGKTAVITGGASGIGLGEHCAGLGMNVVLGDIQQDALDQAVEKVTQRQANVIGVITDTMVKTSVNNLLEEATNTYGNVHLVFNNAGVAAGNMGKAVWEAPDEDWHWVMGVNFYGVLYGVLTLSRTC